MNEEIEPARYRAWLVARGLLKPAEDVRDHFDGPCLRLDAAGKRAAAHAIASRDAAPTPEIANRAFIALTKDESQ